MSRDPEPPLTPDAIRAAWPKTGSGDDLAVWHPDDLISLVRSLPVGDDAPSLDVERLKQALDNEWMDRLSSGGWYDDDAADPFALRAPRIAAEYDRLAPR